MFQGQMDEEPFTMTDDEHLLGKWSITYVPPTGGKFLGQLRVTDQRVIFAADVAPGRFEQTVIGPIDCEAVACALDLDPPNVAYDGTHLCVSIPASQIECVTADDWPLNHCVYVTIRNNGSIHQFDKGLLPVTGVVRAIQQATRATN